MCHPCHGVSEGSLFLNPSRGPTTATPTMAHCTLPTARILGLAQRRAQGPAALPARLLRRRFGCAPRRTFVPFGRGGPGPESVSSLVVSSFVRFLLLSLLLSSFVCFLLLILSLICIFVSVYFHYSLLGHWHRRFANEQSISSVFLLFCVKTLIFFVFNFFSF